MITLLQAARRVSVPIVVVRTQDQAATVDVIVKAVSDANPVVTWDAARGLVGQNKQGTEALNKANPPIKADDTLGFAEAMVAAARLPGGAVLCAYNAHRQLMSSEPSAIAGGVQAVSNLRDQLKKNHRMLVLMGPGFVLPAELDQDVVVFDHALPDAAELRTIVVDTHGSAKLGAPTEDVLVRAVDAVSGLSSFAAEQVTAMSLTRVGLDLKQLWDRKRMMIEQTRGLRVYRGTETFKDIIGLDAVKARLMMRVRGRTPIGVVVFMDEIDKVLANVEQDTSGVRMDQLRTLLSEMEDNEWEGVLLAGLPGGGKSLLAKAFGNEAKVPTIAMDLGAMQGSLVGESEQNLRHAMAVIKAVGGGHAFFLATSNNATVMRPELQRRFTGGFFFVDMLDAAQRTAAWDYYEAKYGLKKQKRPQDEGWTGAEIRNCVREAWNSECPLTDAAKYVLPVAQARADEVQRMRLYANGRFLDANRPGQYDSTRTAGMEVLLRAIDLPGKAN